MSGLPLGVDLFFGDLLSRKSKVRPFQNYVDILILVFFFLVYFCEIQMVDASLFVCLCVSVFVCFGKRENRSSNGTMRRL